MQCRNRETLLPGSMPSSPSSPFLALPFIVCSVLFSLTPSPHQHLHHHNRRPLPALPRFHPPFLTPSSPSSLTPHRPNPFHRHPPRRPHSKHRHHLPSYSAPSFPSRCHHGPRPSHHGPSCGTAPRSRGLQAPKRQPVTGSWHAAPVQTQHQQTTTKRINPAHHQPVVPRFHPPISHPHPSVLNPHFSPPPILRHPIRPLPPDVHFVGSPLQSRRPLSFPSTSLRPTPRFFSPTRAFSVHEIPSHSCSANTS